MKSARWNIYWALLFQSVWMAVFLVPGFIAEHSDSKFLIYGFDNYQEQLHLSASLGVMVLVVYAVRRFKNLTWAGALQFLGYKKPNFKQIIIGLASCLPLVLYWFYRVSCGMVSFDRDLSGEQTTYIIIMAGFFEETFYRGFLFRMFRQDRSFIYAAALSGLLWSFSHLVNFAWWGISWNRQGMFVFLIAVFLYSIPAAWLFERGGNIIWGFMAAHLGWDLGISLFTTNNQFRDLDILRSGQFYYYTAFISSGLVIWALSSWLLRRKT